MKIHPPYSILVLCFYLLSALCASAQSSSHLVPIRVALIGDSTMASYPHPPADRPNLTGWGQVFSEFFVDDVKILNRAISGRSSKSFLGEGRWEPVLGERPQYIFIQFGHNDQPGKGGRTTDPQGDYQENLRRYIDEARNIDAVPILVSPVARRTFQDGKPHSSLWPYVEAVKKVGRYTNTPVIDLHASSLQLYDRLGDDGSADLSASPDDRTHFSTKGARAIAELVVNDIPKADPCLARYLASPSPSGASLDGGD